MHRRTFLKTAATALGAGLTSRFAPAAQAQPFGANDAVRVAVAGINNKGADHILELLKLPGVRIAALCDVDPRILAREVGLLTAKNITVFATTDVRRVLERSDVDALVIASPNHWHALQSVWACQAGKDVYVEKPVSHGVWQGRQMVEAAAKYRRIVQAGTQMRSDIAMPQVIAWLREGHLGKIQWVHSLCYKLREPIGRRLPWYPDWLDYDHFCGPAPMAPLVRNKLHYDWHWRWDTGNGDLANIGIHEFDVARWVAGDPGPPRRILSLGGRFLLDDSGQTPNTQLTVFDYAPIPIILENRGLSAKPGVTYLDQVAGVRQGIYIQCEGGYFAGRYGGWCYDRDGKRVKEFPGDGGAGHLGNFIAAVRSRRSEDLAAPIETGHVSTSTCLFGNISYRLGRPATLDEARRALEGKEPATHALEAMQKHLAVHGVDLQQPRLNLGPWLQIDGAHDEVAAVEGSDAAALERARYLVHEVERPPYAIPQPL